MHHVNMNNVSRETFNQFHVKQINKNESECKCIMQITENDLKTVVDILSYNYNIVASGRFYSNQLYIVMIDKNNAKNHYRIFINTEFNEIIFQYINEVDDTIIDLNSYVLCENSYNDIINDIVILIFSILNYYMNVLVYSIESE